MRPVRTQPGMNLSRYRYFSSCLHENGKKKLECRTVNFPCWVTCVSSQNGRMSMMRMSDDHLPDQK